MIHRQSVGKQAEDLAVSALIKAGYTIIERNWRIYSSSNVNDPSAGEIDVVATHRGDLVFIEVRYRSGGMDQALESFPRRKQMQLERLAQRYLSAKNYGEVSYRIDFAAVSGGKVEILENANSW